MGLGFLDERWLQRFRSDGALFQAHSSQVNAVAGEASSTAKFHFEFAAGFRKNKGGMSILRSVTCRLSWPATLLFVAGAVICFHVAYLRTDFGPLHLAIFGYLMCLTNFRD